MKVHQNSLDLQKSALLSQSRQRFIPTFYHEQIFNYQPAQEKLVRCTPTYHSTVLNTEGYNIETHHKKNQKEKPQADLQSSVYRNKSHEKRVQDLNPHNHVCSTSRQNWYDNTKKQLIDEVKRNTQTGYSRCRKIIDLSSDPVFTQYNYGEQKVNQQQICTRVPQYRCGSDCTCLNCPQSCKTGNCDCNCYRMKPQPKVPQYRCGSDCTCFNCPQSCKTGNCDCNCYRMKPLKNQLPANTIVNQLKVNQEKLKIVEQASKVQAHKDQSKTKKDFHKNCVPDYEKNLKLKGKQIRQKIVQVQTKKQIVSQKPTFTVIRKNRIGRG